VTIGPCTLYCGDCLEVLPTLPAGFADSAVTDPPYGVNLTETRTKHRRVAGTYASVEDSPEFILPLIQAAIPECCRIAKCVVVTPGTRLLQEYPKARDIGSIFFPNGAGIGAWGFITTHPVLYYGKCPYLAKGMGSRPNGVSATHWNRRKNPEHPCEKPLKMMEWLVARASLPGATVLDPFMGSGTTGVACVRLGRKFVGIEKEPKYFDVACQRIKRELRQPELIPA
jgi:DNA modification methylase